MAKNTPPTVGRYDPAKGEWVSEATPPEQLRTPPTPTPTDDEVLATLDRLDRVIRRRR